MKNTLLLDALANRKQFVLCRVVAAEGGKTDKIPTSPHTGNNINGQDPANWMLPQEAQIWAQQWNAAKPPGVLTYGVGLVIYEGCGIFCIDLDICRDPTTGGWYPHVLNFENRFAKAYRETSFSNNGRHIFGSYKSVAPTHGTKNKTYRMESYTKLRFIMVTGEECSGDVLTDCTPELTAFLTEFFPEHEEPEHGVEWTDKPVTTWRGPTNDDELIAKMIRTVSPRAIFGGGAAFSDLWNANGDLLPKAFPPLTTSWSWDRSSADQALSNHLAFWTGNDCERMLRLMWRSRLKREKWERTDYLRRTILDSTGSQHEWFAEKESSFVVELPVTPTLIAVPPPPHAIDAALPTDMLPPVGDLCSATTMKELFRGYCYVRDIHAIQLTDGSSITKERFDAIYGGPQYIISADGRSVKSAWDAFVLSEVFRFPRVETQYFQPGVDTGAIRVREGKREINCYQRIEIRRVQGDASPFLDLLRRMLPHEVDRQILLCYMAACCQHLGAKFKWWPFIQGAKGNGKTTIGQILEYCISYRYTHWAKADQIAEKFNSVFVDKLLLIVDEIWSDDPRERDEILKTLVTAKRIEVRPMHGEKCMKEIRFNGIIFSNHQNGIRIDIDERRYAAFFCAQQSKADKLRDGLTKPYFIALHRWLEDDGFAIIYDFLMSMQILDELNPATHCIEAPVTTSTDLAATASLGGVEQELIEAVKQQHEGFRNGWISSQAVDFLLARCGRDKMIPRNARRGLVMALGYVPHPSLGSEGMLDVPLPDGARPRLYVERGHPWAVSHLTAQQVREGFIASQKES
jgi:Family of unknown function (DUF5906)